MATDITYTGRFDAVDIELAPNLWETVPRGGTVKVSDRLAKSLLEQSDNWAPTKKPAKSEPKKINKEG